ncbi:MAG: ECF-type sigma factor [bacterium]|nr:ECF-type sigma factor [bacterium]
MAGVGDEDVDDEPQGGIETPPKPGVRERFPELYTELRSVAGRVIHDKDSPSLSPSDLMHEAFFKLRAEEQRRDADEARSQLGEKPDEAFKACFGAACRDVLVDRVRRRTAKKRGGGKANEEADSLIMVPGDKDRDAIEVDDAVQALADFDPQLAQLVEARVFGELSIPECAQLLNMSPRTADRRWAFALSWLRERMA